jgi:hypothetical protein
MRVDRLSNIVPLFAMGFILFFSGCGISFVTKLAAPTNLTATTDQVEQIILSWSAVEAANHYYVYRSDVPDGPFGPDGATPYRTVEGIGFIDTDVPGGEYYYAVSAADVLDRVESPLSDVVSGTASIAPPQWRTPLLVGVGTGIVDLAVDTLVTGEPTYVLTAPYQLGTKLTVYRIVDDLTLESVGGPFGAVNGMVPGSAALSVAGGTLFVASTDVTDASDLLAEVILWRFDPGSGTWAAETSASLSNAEMSAPWIDLEARSSTDIFLAYRSEGGALTGPIAAYRYNGITASDLAATLVAAGVDRVTSVHLAVSAATETLLYKKVVAIGDSALFVAKLSAGVWDNPTVISDAADVIPDGYLDAAHDLTTDDLFVVYYDSIDAELVVKKNSAATVLAPTLGSADPQTESVALAANEGEVTVFYREPSGDGVIRKFTGAEWEPFGSDPLTLGGSLSSLAMQATTERLVIGYIEVAVGMIRRYY